jgi:HlyD family secretion protein
LLNQDPNMYRIAHFLLLPLAIACETKPDLARRAKAGEPAVQGEPAVKKVEVVPVGRKAGLEATGTALPVREAVLSAAVPGRISQIPVVRGQRVPARHPLVRLESYGYSLGVQQAEAAVAAATVQAEQAKRELDRAQRLVDAKVAPGATYEQVESAHRAAVAHKQMAEAGLRKAKKALADSTVRAPFDCTVDLILKEVGEYAPSMPPTMLIKVVDASELEVQVFLPERRAGDIGPGHAAQVRIDSAGVESRGEVVFVSNRVQPGTQTFEVRVRIPNPGERIKGGAFARVSFSEAGDAPILVPAAAIVRDGDEAFVFVAVGGNARRLPVTLGESSERGTQITAGLDGERRVIVSGLMELADGDPIVAEIHRGGRQ